jgi:eukaryotic-like serine/threonine-protein kinase
VDQQAKTLNPVWDDGRLMSLVELALSQPAAERREFLESACAGESDLLEQAWNYVQWEERMGDFLLDPLYTWPEDEQPFEGGQLLQNRFRIVREINRGGMGIVYEAEDKKLDRRIAIKCARSAHRKRLPPEVRNAREITHPNVCKIFEIHTASTDHGEVDFVTMEFLEGETLAARLRRGCIPASEAQQIARQLAAGLAEAHRKRVIHGDLKSNNIILTRDADGNTRAVITDFGLARMGGASGAVFSSAISGGTPAYMAPELWRGEGASAASDVYALGVVFYELASARRPFERLSEPGIPTPSTASDTAMFWRARLTQGPGPVNPKWDRILSRCLEPDPERRIRTGAELVRELTPASRRWVLAVAAAVLLTALTSLFTYQRVTSPRENLRLAILPFDAVSGAKALAEGLLLDSGDRLSHVKPGRVRLTVIPVSDAAQNRVDTPAKARSILGATHSLSGTLRQQDGTVLVHAFLTDARTQVRVADWQAKYAPGDIRDIPVALAGMVTLNFRLPPIAVAAAVNSAAYTDWAQGVSLARGDPVGLDRAIELLQRAVAADSASPLTHASLAEAALLKYQSTGDEQWWSSAHEFLTTAEQRNPDVAVVRSVSGLINDASGKYDQAQADVQRALELEPLNGDLWRQLGEIYKHSNRPSEALAAFQKAIELQPNYFKNYYSLGTFYYDQFELAEAVSAYQKMVEVAPEQSGAHFQLSRPYISMGRYSDAEGELRRANSLRQTADGMHALAISLNYQGRDREAIPYYLRAIDLGPPPRNRFVLYMNLGSSYRRAGQSQQAGEAYRKAMELAYAELGKNPRAGFSRSCLAYLSARLGDRQGAEGNAVQALGLSPGDVNVSWMVAQTYETLGERERTLALIQDAPDALLNLLRSLPDLADLQKDRRFLQILQSHHIQ